MKIQDIIFILVFATLIILKKPKLAAGAGLFSLILAIPLFHALVFFTAERLTWYAAAFFLLNIVFQMIEIKNSKPT